MKTHRFASRRYKNYFLQCCNLFDIFYIFSRGVLFLHKETKKVDALDSSVCDKCGNAVEFNPYESQYNYDWFEMTTGHGDLGGGGGLHYTTNLCESCAGELIDLLKSNGYYVRETEWYY